MAIYTEENSDGLKRFLECLQIEIFIKCLSWTEEDKKVALEYVTFLIDTKQTETLEALLDNEDIWKERVAYNFKNSEEELEPIMKMLEVYVKKLKQSMEVNEVKEELEEKKEIKKPSSKFGLDK
jgi:hypothetical protein